MAATEVDSWNNILANFKQFDASKKNTHAFKRFGQYSHWYYCPQTDSFAPSKFLGYKDMTMESYRGEGDGRETLVVLNEYFDKLDRGTERFAILLFKLEKWAKKNGKKISKKVKEGSGGIHFPKQEYIPADWKSIPFRAIDEAKLEKFTSLFSDFSSTYLVDKGEWHNNFYLKVRDQAKVNYSEIQQLNSEGADITDQVLLRLLPYNDNESNRESGAWVHIAPAITGDIKKWFENANWAKSEDWPRIANSVFQFINDCVDGHKNIYQACKSFSASQYSKGFSMGMLTPVLNALEPSEYLLINSKSRKVIAFLSNYNLSSALEAYHQINLIGFKLIEELLESFESVKGTKMLSSDLFDMFCHWCISENKIGDDTKVQHWKIAPGENAFNWDNCLEGGYISVGWDALGDIGGMKREEYEQRYKEVMIQQPELKWDNKVKEQPWRFSRLPKDTMIVANKGTSEILGFGKVIGGYYFVPNERHGHRLPVEWFDIEHRKVNEQGWRRTMVKLKKSKYEELRNIEENGDPENDDANAWIFQSNPKYFDIKAAVKDLKEVAWLVNQYKSAIKEGDDVYMWMSGSDAGILAAGKVLSNPANMLAREGEEPYVLTEEKFEGTKLRVPVSIDKPIDPPLLRKDLLEHPILKDLDIIRFANATNFRLKEDEAQILSEYIRTGVLPGGPTQEEYTMADFVNDTAFSAGQIERWLASLRRKQHVIFQGPPGTGKTYVAERLAKLMVSKTTGIMDIVQFHPAYAYEDFMQGFRPKPSSEGGFEFELESGRFLRFCAKAGRTKDPCVLIIDEINRAHLARVFGELMYLLEYRDKEIYLSSGGERFKIPENVYIIGTMNTADRSIALVDHALRRRFSFIRLQPEYDVLQRYLQNNSLPHESLIKVLKDLNRVIGDRNYEVGISYFMKDPEQLKQNISNIWQEEIEPYLEEYFYDQPEKAEPLRWDDLVQNKLKDWS